MSSSEVDRGGTVVPLRPEGADVVHEAEIVDETPRPTWGTRRLPAIPVEARQRMADGAVQLHRRATPAARTSSSWLVRQALYTGSGVAVVYRRRRDARSADPYVRAMRAAEAAGDAEAVERWAELIERSREARHRRRMDWVKSPIVIAKTLLISAVALAVLLLAIGVAVAVNTGEVADVLGPFRAVATAVAFVFWLVTAYGVLIATGAIAVAVVYLWHQGRTHAAVQGPSWAQGQKSGSEVTETGLDEGMIMNALRNLDHPALNRRIRENGWGTSIAPTWVQPPMPFNRHGWSFSLRLPAGVPATSINQRKEIFAHNLGRKPEEVWIKTNEDDPMAMEATVLNPGALRAPIAAYPLIEEGQTDFWRGFPIGVDARHEPVVAQLFERNFVWAGTMGSGKSTQVIGLLAGAALDPLVDIDVWCFADNNDYDWLRPLASVNMGDTEDNVQSCLDHIHALHDDLAVRGQLLREHNIAAVTREAAAAEPRLRPRVVIIDECQSLFRQDKPEDRREVVNSLVRFFSAARKYGIVLGFATPTPSDQSLPRDLVAVTSNKSCFAIGDKARNNIVLGDKAHENGISALGLRPAETRSDGTKILNDVGTSVSVGFMSDPGIVRSYHLTDEQRKRVIERALELRGEGPARAAIAEPEQRDLLTDVAAVLTGPDPVSAAQVGAALAAAHPRHRAYQGLTKKGLADWLGEHGVTVPSTGNSYPVHPDRVAEAIRARSADAEDAE